jgi:hypothetical protein
MLRAEIHGKIADDAHDVSERKEDILTSNVFGSFRYLPAGLALIPWLGHAEACDAAHPLVAADVTDAEVFFWPKVGDREPDVLVLLKAPGGMVDLVVVECKYHSGKSQAAGADDGDDDQQRTNGLWQVISWLITLSPLGQARSNIRNAPSRARSAGRLFSS